MKFPSDFSQYSFFCQISHRVEDLRSEAFASCHSEVGIEAQQVVNHGDELLLVRAEALPDSEQALVIEALVFIILSIDFVARDWYRFVLELVYVFLGEIAGDETQIIVRLCSQSFQDH